MRSNSVRVKNGIISKEIKPKVKLFTDKIGFYLVEIIKIGKSSKA